MIYPKELVFKIPCIPVAEFASHHGITAMAVYAAIKKNQVDYTVIGKRATLIVLTEKTQVYEPNRS